MAVDTTVLLTLIIRTLEQIPEKYWRPDELVDAVKAKAPTTERVSSAEIKSAIWRLAGDNQINMTPDRHITSVSSESETQTFG